MVWTYTLLLEDGHYYVGKTDHLKHRIRQHQRGQGSKWTSLHKMVAVDSLQEGDFEKETTLQLMKEYGTENVRGYTWSAIDGSNLPVVGEEE